MYRKFSQVGHNSTIGNVLSLIINNCVGVSHVSLEGTSTHLHLNLTVMLIDGRVHGYRRDFCRSRSVITS